MRVHYQQGSWSSSGSLLTGEAPASRLTEREVLPCERVRFLPWAMTYGSWERAANAKSSPTAVRTLPSMIPMGGTRNPATTRPTETVSVTVKTMVWSFVFIFLLCQYSCAVSPRTPPRCQRPHRRRKPSELWKANPLLTASLRRLTAAPTTFFSRRLWSRRYCYNSIYFLNLKSGFW